MGSSNAAHAIQSSRFEDLPYAANAIFNRGPPRSGTRRSSWFVCNTSGGVSHLHVGRSVDDVTDWRFDPAPLLVPEPDRYPEEIWGCEDPRLTWLPERDERAISYTAYSRRRPLVDDRESQDVCLTL